MPRGKPDDPFKDDDWGMPGDAQEPSGEMPEAETDPSRTPFLKPFNLKEREGRIELLSVSGATEYSDVVLHVQVGPRHFRMGLRTFDPGYKALRSKFGGKREDWHGPLRYRIMPHKGNANGYVAVRPA